jgi:hypothetical protein
MKKSTEKVLWIVGGAAALYYLFQANKSSTIPVAANVNQPQTGTCNLSCNISQAVCSIASLV